MSEPQPLEKDKEPRHWILQTFGLAFGLAVLLVVMVTAVVMAVESPSNRRAAVRAEPISSTTAPDAMAAAAPGHSGAPEQAVTEAPIATVEPTQTPIAREAAVAAPTQTTFDVNLPLVANQNRRTIAQAPARTPLPTATPLPSATPVRTATARSVARSAVATRTAAPKSSTPVQRQPARTATPIRALDFSFYVKEYCATERSRQILKVVITGHGGAPPYTYYNDATQIGQTTEGTVALEVKAALGNPVPFNLTVVDKTGQRFNQTFFYKSTVHCYWKPLK